MRLNLFGKWVLTPFGCEVEKKISLITEQMRLNL